MGKSKTIATEVVMQERVKCEGCGTEENLHIQRFKGYHKAIMCYACRDDMNAEIKKIIKQVKQVGIDDDETIILTETDNGVEISKIKTKCADAFASNH